MYARLLKRAAEVLGSAEALREYLGVSAAQLNFWMRGAAPPPDSVFLRLADLLAEKQQPLGQTQRPD